jgi:hypothetical protein
MMNLESHPCVAHSLNLVVSNTITGFFYQNKIKLPQCQHFFELNRKVDKFISSFSHAKKRYLKILNL